MRDVEFLARLVHRGHMTREDAKGLVPAVEGGESLDALLEEKMGWSAREVARLRRTRAGELPEIPGYAIEARIGTGGTAFIFRARERKTGEKVALKVLKPECTTQNGTLQSFVAEARLLKRLEHPGLVRCFGVARSGSTFFSRLELIEGETLLERLDRGGTFGEEEALQVVLDVAEVLCFLGREGVVHRDVKPGNIMIDSSGRIVVLDLGFAAPSTEGEGDLDEDSTGVEDSATGTVAYLAPEQARGGAAADIRSDIYSLGISLFHILIGRLPFEGSDDQEVLRKQVQESLNSPELKSRSFSHHVHYIIERMVAKEADDRYQNWTELMEDIRGQIDGRASLDFEAGARAGKTRPRRRR